VIGDLLCGILNAEPGTVALCENVTIAQAIALSAVEFHGAPRNRLVCSAEDFPSVLYLYEGLARRAPRSCASPRAPAA
jgi:kynureninase